MKLAILLYNFQWIEYTCSGSNRTLSAFIGCVLWNLLICFSSLSSIFLSLSFLFLFYYLSLLDCNHQLWLMVSARLACVQNGVYVCACACLVSAKCLQLSSPCTSIYYILMALFVCVCGKIVFFPEWIKQIVYLFLVFSHSLSIFHYIVLFDAA